MALKSKINILFFSFPKILVIFLCKHFYMLIFSYIRKYRYTNIL